MIDPNKTIQTEEEIVSHARRLGLDCDYVEPKHCAFRGTSQCCQARRNRPVITDAMVAAGALLAAAKKARDYLIRELQEPGRSAFWTLVEAIRSFEASASQDDMPRGRAALEAEWRERTAGLVAAAKALLASHDRKLAAKYVHFCAEDMPLIERLGSAVAAFDAASGTGGAKP